MRWLIRKVSIALCVLLLSFACMGGCNSSAERIAAVQGMLNQAVSINQTIDVSLEDVNKVIADCQLILLDPNIPDSTKQQVQTILVTATSKFTALRVEKQKVTFALVQYQAILDSVDINNADVGTELQIVSGVGLETAKYLPPPYNLYVGIGVGVLGLLGSILKNIKQRQQIIKDKQQINQDKTAFTNVVVSVKELLDPANEVIPADKVQSAVDVLKVNQLPITRQKVDTVLDPMKNIVPSA